MAEDAARWGLLSLDWSIANGIWDPPGTPDNKTTGASTLVQQCQLIKAVPQAFPTKCFVYRNTELALLWLEPQRAAMLDATMRDYFLQYQAVNPGSVPAGTLYNENAGGPCAGCSQYFWNYSNPAAVQYVLKASEAGKLGTDSPFVDGTFLDDVTGVPAEHPNAPTNMGLTAAEVATLQNATQAFVQAAIEQLAGAGKYTWAAFGAQDGVGAGPNQQSCVQYMAERCTAAWQAVPWTLQWSPGAEANQTLAAFLIARGPVAYVGYGWNGGPLPPFDPLWDLDVGQPQGLCTQPSPGVFTRVWSNGVATLDCVHWQGLLDF